MPGSPGRRQSAPRFWRPNRYTGRARLRAEADALRNDPEDVAASRELVAEIEADAIHRGDLYRLKAPRDVRGHEQAGTRYAVVVQSDDLPLSTWLIAPTSTGRRAASFRPEVEINGIKTRVMVEQLTAIDPETRLGEFAGRLCHADMRAIDTALRAVLAVD